MNITEVLKSLELSATQPGTWSGDGGWLGDVETRVIESINPTTGRSGTTRPVITSRGSTTPRPTRTRVGSPPT